VLVAALVVAAASVGVVPASATGTPRFSDVAPDRFYAEPVEWARSVGVVVGYSAACFLPDEPATRAEVAVVLYRALGSPDTIDAVHPFTDVALGWQTDAVSWLYVNGLTTGIDDTSFGPGRLATRAEVATFIWRAAGRPESETVSTFFDVTKPWQVPAVTWLQQSGISSGRSPSIFDPEATITRGELVTLVWRWQDRPDGPVDLTPSQPRNCMVEVGRCVEMFPGALVAALESAHPGTRVTVAVRDLRTGCSYDLNPDLVITTSSVIKA
jgi:hypothetical protein